MNDELVGKLKTRTFIRRIAILKVFYYNLKELLVLYVPVKEKAASSQVNGMRKGYIHDTLTSVDIQEVVKLGGKSIKICECVVHKKIFDIAPFRNIIKFLFTLRLN